MPIHTRHRLHAFTPKQLLNDHTHYARAPQSQYSPQKCCSKGFGICHVFTCYILSNPNLEKRPKLLTSLAQSINRKGVQPKISASWSNSLQRALRFCCARCSQEQVAENLSGSPGAL